MNKQQSGCNDFTNELNRLQTQTHLLENNSLLHIRSYSYPFKGLKLTNFPNIVELTVMLQDMSILTRIFDLKIIVMKRNWIECLVSSCVHRFGQCGTRIQYLPTALDLLQSQLLAIDPKFWIMIDYDDMMHRPMEYVPLIAKYLQLDKKIVQHGFDVIDTKKINKNSKSLSEKEKTRNALKEMRSNDRQNAMRWFYGSYNPITRWPLFNSDYFLVTPENTAFLDSKFD